MRKYHHVGYPTNEKRDDEYYMKDAKVTIVVDPGKNDYGIEKSRNDVDYPAPDLLKNVPHIAFEVDNIEEEIKGKEVILGPKVIDFCGENVEIAFIAEEGIPIEFLSFIDRK